jgi:hypothetical protein
MILAWLRKQKRMADLVVGEIATVKGVVQSEQQLAIPLSGTACVYYELMRERYGKGSRGRGRPLWFPESFESKCVAFRVSDDTGMITVRAPSERVKVQGAHREGGAIRGSRKRRFFAEFLRTGDTVIARGHVGRSSEGADLVLTAPSSKMLQIKITRSSGRPG